ncbi:uncharacterized protein TrAtP1_011096 [Trichoderma atroviride]|uniref:uncharacterized protein n=1 Tax=Hypocrea atroviridis TaxID=63577 RepID=UPI0033198D51|nr:hypothetical protein TrAtP1_011096 [Trichoderma atroviride]
MAKSLLAASVVEAAGESSLLYLQHYATGVYKGVYEKVKAEQAWQIYMVGTYARRGREEQHAPQYETKDSVASPKGINLFIDANAAAMPRSQRAHEHPCRAVTVAYTQHEA